MGIVVLCTALFVLYVIITGVVDVDTVSSAWFLLLGTIVYLFAVTPRESMPDVVQWIMSGTPTLHFVSYVQAVLLRGANISMVWPQILMMSLIGIVFFLLAHRRLRQTMGSMG